MKKLIVFAFALLMCFTLIGCDKKDDTDGKISNENQTDLSDMEVGKSKVEKKGNSVLVTINNGTDVSVTDYKFTNNVLTSATITQKFPSSALAKAFHEEIKNEPTIIEQYMEIKLSGSTVTLVLKDDILMAYEGLDQDAFYDMISQLYTND